MKKTFLRLFAALLALLTVFSVLSLIGCTEKDGPTEDEGKKEEGETEELVVPNKKFNEDFVIATQSQSDFYYAEPSSDIVQQAVYTRNSAVESRFGVRIKPKEMEYYTIPDHVSTLVKAGDDTALDLVANHIVFSSAIVIAGNAVDFYEAPYISLEKSWWPETNVNDMTLNDKCYLAVGDFALTSIAHTLCMFFNKDLAETFKMGDIYGLVNDKKWTYTTFYNLIKDVRADSDNNGKYNAKDTYGFTHNSFASNTMYLWGFNNPVFSRNANTGELECTFMSGKITTIMKTLVTLFYKTDGCFYSSGGTTMFEDGRAVFVNGTVSNMTGVLRDMENWGIIPMPMYNDAQAKTVGYVTMVGGGSNALIIPKIGNKESRLEKIGAVLETLEYYSHKDVIPTFYNKALKGKYADSPQEAPMIDLIVNSRIVDLGYIYLGFEGPSFTCQSMLESRDYNIATKWAAQKSVYESKIEEFYAAYGLEFEGLE